MMEIEPTSQPRAYAGELTPLLHMRGEAAENAQTLRTQPKLTEAEVKALRQKRAQREALERIMAEGFSWPVAG